MKSTFKKLPILLLICAALIPAGKSRGTINSVTLTPANPTLLSNGLSYYLAGKAYIFTVQVTDPDVAAWGDITDVRVTIPNSVNIVVALNPGGTGNRLGDISSSTGPVDVIQANIPVIDTPNNFTVTLGIRFRWDTAESNWAAARSIVGSATTTVPANNTLTNTKLVSYGVNSSIRILNFAQDGDASDGRVNPWHTAFNVTGTIVYDVPGASSTDAVHLVADAGAGEYNAAGAELYRNGNATGHTDAAPAALSITVTAEWFITLGWATAAGNHNWTVRVTMNTAGGPETSTNTLAINCDRIEVTLIEFINGGGVGPTGPIFKADYYRNVNVPGTQIRVTAELDNAGTPMVGNTYIVFQDNSASSNQFTVLIANGQPQGVVNITYPAVPADVPDNATTALTYTAIRVYGGAYDGDIAAAEGQDNPADIPQPIHPTFYWDSNDPPGANGTNFTAWIGQTQTSFSFTINWTPLTEGAPDLDADFYTYRIYHKSAASSTWLVVDRNTTGYATLGTINTGSVSISGLSPITIYNYYLTAVDVFGQEVVFDTVTGADQAYEDAPAANPDGDYFGKIATAAVTILTDITDGVDEYDDDSFTGNISATTRPVRKSAIRVRFSISGGTEVDAVNIIVAADPGANLVNISTGQLIGVEGTDYWKYSCTNPFPNSWVGYIPETNPLMAIGSNVKFIIGLIKSGVEVYADHDSEGEAPPGDPNNYEWNFAVVKQTTFKPWPVRILNNVITKKHPVAYPSYYLSDDAYVTIRVFDIKGRQVVTLLDNAYRRGGQNIKERGWRGDNKAQRKLGVGLYYIQIRAKRASDGKVILNKFRKVVMAR